MGGFSLGLYLFLIGGLDTVHVRSGSIKLDGIEDRVWQKADSAIVDVMSEPYYGEKSTYKSIVKVLQDRHNLYVLFRVDYGHKRPSLSLSGNVDHYTVFLDPLKSNVEAYVFSVSAAGERFDGMVLADGKGFDEAWDGVWDAKTRVLEIKGHYFVISEFKIPFKTLKFDRNNHAWGANFRCSFEDIDEKAWWILPPENEDVKVSQFGILEGVNASDEGIGLEVYPVFLTRHEYSKSLDINKFKIRGGLDLKYKRGSYSMNITTFPDFAEIEADPFRMSLGRGEIYYPEKRPFFLEGQEVFQSSGVRFSPVEILYTRRIGKKYSSIAGEVPIVFGGKFINKGNKTEVGLMSVLTGRLNTPSDTIFPMLWNAFRVKQKVWGNSEIGSEAVLLKGLHDDSLFYAGEIDGILRRNRNAFAWQLVGNKKGSDNPGMLFQTGGLYYLRKNYSVGFYSGLANSEFDVSPTGYSGFFAGDKIGSLMFSYYKYGRKGGKFRRLVLNIALNGVKYAEDPGISRAIQINSFVSFLRPWMGGMHMSFAIGRDYTKDSVREPYTSKSAGMGFWGRIKEARFHVNYEHVYGWNYMRRFKARYGFASLGFYIPVTLRLSLDYDITAWNEYMPDGSFLISTLSGEARLRYRFSPFMEVALSNNHVGFYSDSVTPLVNRFSLYYSWEIRPKSKVYVVLNEFLSKEGNVWKSTEHIYAFKIRYLFLF